MADNTDIKSFKNNLCVDEHYKIDCSNKLIYNIKYIKSDSDSYKEYFEIKNTGNVNIYRMNKLPIFIVKASSYTDFSISKVPILERKIASNMYKFVFES